MSTGYRTRLSAFTLIELLVVIAIIVVLISLLLPALKSARRNAVTVREMAAGNQLIKAYLNYAEDHAGFIMRSVLPAGVIEWEGTQASQPSYRFFDERGRQINPVNASPYPWRIAPYLNFEHQALVLDRALRENQLQRADRPDDSTRKSKYYAVSRNTTFGINPSVDFGHIKVHSGGTLLRRELKLKVDRLDSVLFPTRLMIFASARGLPPEIPDDYAFTTVSEFVPGHSSLEPPRYPQCEPQFYDNPSHAWNPQLHPSKFGWLDLRHSSKAIAMQFDGHAELLGLTKASRAGLRDMRRWCNSALTDNWDFPGSHP